MSDRLIVAKFDTQNAAYDAARAIKGLKDAEMTDFDLKAGVMVTKDSLGNVSLVEDQSRPPIVSCHGRGSYPAMTDGMNGAPLALKAFQSATIALTTVGYERSPGVVPAAAGAAYCVKASNLSARETHRYQSQSKRRST